MPDVFSFDPNNPVFSLPYDPKGGSGILKVPVWMINNDLLPTIKFMIYQWSETVNGVEVEVEKPYIPFASAIEEDIYNAMKQEMKFDTLNFITK